MAELHFLSSVWAKIEVDNNTVELLKSKLSKSNISTLYKDTELFKHLTLPSVYSTSWDEVATKDNDGKSTIVMFDDLGSPIWENGNLGALEIDLSRTVFISGHGTLTFDEFITYYKSRIDKALALGYSFIIGDFRGCDVMVQEYLKDKTPNVTICHIGKSPRYKVDTYELKSAEWKYVSGIDANFNTDVGRDAYMTMHSDEDIAWVRKGRENSGTDINIKRRRYLDGLN